MIDWHRRVREHTLALVRQPSISGSEGERVCAGVIAQRLRAMPYFAAHPDHVRVLRTLDDPLERYSVVAHVAGDGERAILLAGHYDVVSTANYGSLEPVACDPDALLPLLIAELAAGPRGPADQLALDDLRSGDFMPGRGALDMKSGIAAGLAVLEHFATIDARVGNVVLICTPDEEATSQGMRSFVRQWPALRAEWGLEPALAINLDASVASGDGADGRAVFMGSVSKLLPFVHFVGRPTHAGAPFDGIGATLMAAELVRDVECNPDYSDPAPTMGELPPVPVTLRNVDLKGYYDVTTPAQAFVAFNVLSYGSSPAQVLARMTEAARRATEAGRASMRARSATQAARAGVSVANDGGVARILSFAELLVVAGHRAGHDNVNRTIAQSARDTALDPLAVSQRMVSDLVRAANLEGPAAIIGFAPVYYPLASAPAVGAAPVDGVAAALASAAAAVARELGTPIAWRPFFTGISDMSFLAGALDAAQLGVMAANTPAWSERWLLSPLNVADAPGLTVNIGPWGRDYHQRTERVHMPYAFAVLPELLWRIVRDVLGADRGRLA